ncbi:MAG: WYL domain-containing protein, partial [Bacteroidota bacterium]
IGVTVNQGQEPQRVRLYVENSMAPYLLTKPLHHSQTIIDRGSQAMILQLKVQLNFELEKEILSLSPFVKVLEPERLKRKIQDRLTAAIDHYQSELPSQQIPKMIRRFIGRGYLHHKLFLRKEIAFLKKLLLQYFQQHGLDKGNQPRRIDNLTSAIPVALDILLNEKLGEILAHLLPETELISASYYEQPLTESEDWQLDHLVFAASRNVLPEQTILVRIFLYQEQYRNLSIYCQPGSQHEVLREAPRSENENKKRSTLIEAQTGEVLITHPFLLTRSPKGKQSRKSGAIYLVYSSAEA